MSTDPILSYCPEPLAGMPHSPALPASARALLDRQAQRPDQLTETGGRGVVRQRRHQVKQPLVRRACLQRLQQVRPGRRERGAVQVTGQVAAQLDGVPVLRARLSGEPAFRGPGRVRFVLRRLGLWPLFTVFLQLATVLLLDRVILAWPVRSAGLFAHWHSSSPILPPVTPSRSQVSSL